jgi:hypothetical protein
VLESGFQLDSCVYTYIVDNMCTPDLRKIRFAPDFPDRPLRKSRNDCSSVCNAVVAV